MAKSPPDTDPLKREPPGKTSKVPHKDVARRETPKAKPDKQGGAETGGRPGDKATQFDGNPSPEAAPSSPLKPKDDTPMKLKKKDGTQHPRNKNRHR